VQSSETGAKTGHKTELTNRPHQPVRCYYCKATGHTMSVCRKRLAKLAQSNRGNDTSVQLVSVSPNIQLQHRGENHPHLKAVADGYRDHCFDAIIETPDGSRRHICALRDTGALQSLVSRQKLDSTEYVLTGEHRLIRGISGEAHPVALVQIIIQSSLGSGVFLCGLIDILPPGIDMLIGNDICPSGCSDVGVVTRAQAARMKKETQTVQPSSSHEIEQVSNPDIVVEDEDEENLDLGQLFDDSSYAGTSRINRDELIKLQQADPTLELAYSLVQDKSKADATKPFYFIRDDVLMRAWRNKSFPVADTITQIVVPVPLRPKLLYISHDIPAAGHLGQRKTRARLLQHFYWPTVERDIKEYCRTCDRCQRLGKGPVPSKAPLQSLPLVDEPFKRLIIDIVGPLPVCKESGNRFVLTVLDACTHYPEAVPLKQHTAKDVALALMSVWSRFGFCEEIQSDQGTDFMSELMQVFLTDFGIAQIKSSITHPQSQGASERFHATLKNMLRALSDQFPENWDQALPLVLFAYREVPVETLGYSPFELLFARSVRGPLSLLKHTWLSEEELQGSKQSVLEFVLETRERLRNAIDMANEHASAERSKAKLWYDRKARLRTFEVGDKVLVLLPTPGKGLHAKYSGPYEIIKRIGSLDYVVATPDRRKMQRVCHINLLRPYRDRDLKVFPPTAYVVTSVESRPSCKDFSNPLDCENKNHEKSEELYGSVMTHLTPSQQDELKDLLQRYSDVFAENPGRTNLTVHHIDIALGTKPIRSLPYRLNPTKTEYLKVELKKLQELGIIEESDSPWSSPVVMVPKPDNTLRLCTDFRKINSVTTADPFPMPRVDDLIDRVGKAKFLTKVDMTRGYWQVPLDDDSVPISAFVTPFGHFQWRYMAFGLRNAPATFSRLVSRLPRGLETFCAAYLDDIIIFSESWEQHIQHLDLVLARIKKAGLTLNLLKCEFAAAELDYLGHHVGLGRVQPRLSKVQALLEFPTPTNCRQLQQFLGVAGYYRKFVPHYAHISAALSDLLKKGANFV